MHPSRLHGGLISGLLATLGLAVGCRTQPEFEDGGLPPVTAQPTGNCVLDGRGGVCTAAGCTLSVRPDALSVPTPVEIARTTIPTEVEDALEGSSACVVGPSTLSLEIPAVLSIEVDTVPDGFEAVDAVGVFVEGTSLRLAPDTQVRPDGRALTLGVEGAATVALGFRVRGIRTTDVLSADAGPGDADVAFLRNLSSRAFHAAFFDGQRLYLGHGARVLIYEQGVPTDPLQPPDVVVGARGLAAEDESASSSDLGGNAAGIWSDGQRLVVAAGHRVLMWNQIPSSDYAPADLVLGQPNFTSNQPNRGRGVSADSLAAPQQIFSDGRRLLVADSGNNRVLMWDPFPQLIGQPADLVIGQENFEKSDVRGGAVPLYQARGVAYVAGRTWMTSTFGANCLLGLEGYPTQSNQADDVCLGNRTYRARVGSLEFAQAGAIAEFGRAGLGARDFAGQRVVVWRGPPMRADQRPDLLLGKPGFDVGGDEVGGLNLSSIGGGGLQSGLYGGGPVIIPDGRRVLVYETQPSVSYAPADLVIGQGSHFANEAGVDYGELDADSLARPGGISVSPSGEVVIADTANDRVLLLREGGRTVVLGQPDARSFGPNRWGPVGADTMSGPSAVAWTDDGLFVSDSGNHRVLFWRSAPTADGAPADFAIGQPLFRSGDPNYEGGVDDEGFYRPSPQGLFYPSGLTVLDGRLFVADTHNNRVLGFTLPIRAMAARASIVIGQEGFDTGRPNRGGGFLTPVPGGLALPTGLANDGTHLFVADTENNRVLRYAPPFDGDPQVVGQDDASSHRAPNFEPSAPGVSLAETRRTATEWTLRRPTGLAITADTLFVGDTGNHRVVAFSARNLGPWSFARWVLGQASDEGRQANAFGPGPRSLSSPTGLAVRGDELLVLDRGNHRMLGFGIVNGLPELEASGLFGQPDYLSNGFDRSLGSRRDVADPAGVVRAGGILWVADRSRNRVLGYEDGEVSVVLGQPDASRTLANAGGEPSGRSLALPTSIATNGTQLAVADTGNHRILIWDSVPEGFGQPADRVIGQQSFSEIEPNRGRGLAGAGPDGLRAPGGIAFDGSLLLVADSGHNRVVVFDLESRASDAVDVLCQLDFTGNLPNRGERVGPAGCFAPQGVVRFDEMYAVADSANDRVLLLPRTGAPGRPAERVLGQVDLVSRKSWPAAADKLAFPVALATDGVNLLVVDQGNHRVLSFYGPELDEGRARQVVGQPGFESSGSGRGLSALDTPAAVFAEPTSFIESRLLVADSGNGRVLQVSGIRR